jgi:signal transduction histidine kinase
VSPPRVQQAPGALGTGDFLRGKAPYLAIVALVTVITILLLTRVYAVDTPLALLASGILLVGSLLALVPEFLIKRRYYCELADALAHLEKKYLLADVIEYPDFVEGRILYDTLRLTGKSMNDEIAHYELKTQEYREYIEMWVHEIKTPLVGMKLLSENTKMRELLTELDRTEFLVEQVLYYARSNAVEKDYQIKQTDLSELVGTVIKNNARLLIAHKVKVRNTGLAHTVLTDAKWTTFILRQIIDNAVKYQATTLGFSARAEADGVRLCVRDDGVGISDADIGRIFEKGFTGENGRRFGRATGLGLYICYRLCQRLGLGIAARSAPGQGTVIELYFPRRHPLEY